MLRVSLKERVAYFEEQEGVNQTLSLLITWNYMYDVQHVCAGFHSMGRGGEVQGKLPLSIPHPSTIPSICKHN